MSFLKAKWKKLIMINYVIDPKILTPYVPKGTVLDEFNGACYVSLIGFMFMDTKLMGMKIPFHINFEEVNLRFYVKRKEKNKIKRGVVFIKEIVPKLAITFVANTLYNEKYETLKMKHEWREEETILKVGYDWKKEGKWNSIAVTAINKEQIIEEDSEIEFISEHYWGYSKHRENSTTEYEVRHPKWKYYPIKDYKVDVNFSETYGTEFSFLNSAKPKSVMLLEGSEISVEGKKIISE